MDDSFLYIPKSVLSTAGAEYSAVILEALSWESYYRVSPVFYDEILYARAAKDTEDKDMLQLIMETRSYDPGLYYDVYLSGLHGGDGFFTLSATGSTDVVSKFKTYGDNAVEAMNRINQLVDGNGYND